MVRHKNLGIDIDTKKLIIDEYNKNTSSFKEISLKFSITTSSLCKILKDFNIPKRKIIRRIKNLVKDETRHKISNALIKAHSEGRHPGWTSVNSKKEASYPERFFLDKFNSNIDLKKYQLVEKYQYSKYVLDFAILEYKINIEIDGQFHFNDEKTIVKDILRNEYLTKSGWKVFRINWVNFKDSYSLILEELNVFINSSTNIRYDIKDVKYVRNICSCGKVIAKKSKKCIECWTPSKKIIISDEELSKLILEFPFTKIAKILRVSDVGIRKHCIKRGLLK